MSGHSVNRYTIESRKVHKSDQRGHLTLKYRNNETVTRKSEAIIKVSKEDIKPFISEIVDEEKNSSSSLKVDCNQLGIEALAQICPTKDIKSEEELELELGDGVEEDESDDDQELLRELEKIKKERAQKEKDKKNDSIKLMMQNNPLLEEFNENERENDESDKEEYVLKKRWTEDTVFRNQNKVSQSKKRFINDILHSDQHREFMKKYIL